MQIYLILFILIESIFYFIANFEIIIMDLLMDLLFYISIIVELVKALSFYL
jgi:hypothetical protein